MQDNSQFTMVSPAPGFAARVMTRLAEHERARARRRALIGSALLVGAAIAVLVFAAIRLASTVWMLVTNPSVIVALLNLFEPSAVWAGKVFEAVWVAGIVVTGNLDPAQVMLCAAAVFALTMFWVRAVTGSFQLGTLTTNHVGGLQK